MISERYRCAIYSDLEDEEDETEFAYESGEEEFLDPKKMEEDSVSAIEEISNNDFIFGSFHQYSDLKTICVIPAISIKSKIEGCTMKIGEINCFLGPSFLNPEVKDEEKFQKIGKDETKIDFLFFKKILPTSPDSVCISHFVFLASDLFHDLRLEFGNLSPTAMSSPEAIDSAKPSGLSTFTFDPGGVLKAAVYAVGKFIAAFHRQLAFDLPYDAAGQHRNFIFDRGKPPLVTDRIRSSSHPSSSDLIEKSGGLIFANPILVFDPSGSLAVDISIVVVFAFCCGVRILLCFSFATIQSSRTSAFLLHF